MAKKKAAKKAKRSWERRERVRKKCRECGSKKDHGTYKTSRDGKVHACSRCVDCERARAKKSRAAAKAKVKPAKAAKRPSRAKAEPVAAGA